MMTNKSRSTLYVGVTNDLERRVNEHKNHLNKGSFTDTYNCVYCVFYEEHSSILKAISREKEIKKWNRKKKEQLIIGKNPEWLTNEIIFVKEKPIPIKEQVENLLNELKNSGKI